MQRHKEFSLRLQSSFWARHIICRQIQKSHMKKNSYQHFSFLLRSKNKRSINGANHFILSLGVSLLLIAASALISGCASVGHKFNYDASANLELGKMQASDYQSIFGGKPTATSKTTTADGKFEVVRYTYAFADMGTARARTVVLEFKDGRLNAYVYLSSFDREQNPVALEKVSQIKDRVSTKSEVLDILGKPNGKALCPSTLDDFKQRCEKCIEVWTWQGMGSLSTFGAAYGGKRPAIKTIFVSFDKNGVVSESQINDTSN